MNSLRTNGFSIESLFKAAPPHQDQPKNCWADKKDVPCINFVQTTKTQPRDRRRAFSAFFSPVNLKMHQKKTGIYILYMYTICIFMEDTRSGHARSWGFMATN